MTIAAHVHSLQQHLAQLGLQRVPAGAGNGESEVFKISFLNKHAMQRWRALQDSRQQEVNILSQRDRKS